MEFGKVQCQQLLERKSLLSRHLDELTTQGKSCRYRERLLILAETVINPGITRQLESTRKQHISHMERIYEPERVLYFCGRVCSKKKPLE